MASEIISTEPATGAVLWRARSATSTPRSPPRAPAGPPGPRSRSPTGSRRMRRFANVVRAKCRRLRRPDRARDRQAAVGSAHRSRKRHRQGRRLGRRLFRTHRQRRLESPMGMRMAVRHKPHGVLAVLGPYNFPAHLPNGHIVPALIAGNAIVFKPSEKTPAQRRVPDRLPARRRRAGELRAARDRRPGGGQGAGRAPRDRRRCCSPARRTPASRSTASSRPRPEKILALEMGGNNPIVVWSTPDLYVAAIIVIQSAFTTAGPALHRRAPADRRRSPVPAAGRHAVEADRPPDHRRAARRPRAVHGPGDRQRDRRPADRELPRADDPRRPAAEASAAPDRGPPVHHARR